VLNGKVNIEISMYIYIWNENSIKTRHVQIWLPLMAFSKKYSRKLNLIDLKFVQQYFLECMNIIVSRPWKKNS
jgi:hypothetical protein